MKFKMQNYLPYKIDPGAEDIFYNKLDRFADEVFLRGKECLNDLITRSFGTTDLSESHIKTLILEFLITGVLWKCHIDDAIKTSSISLSELSYFKKLAEAKPGSDIYRKIYLRMRSDSLLHGNLYVVDSDENTETAFIKLLDWLKATEEYKYEIPVMAKWLKIWKLEDVDFITYAVVKILAFTQIFIETGDKLIGSSLNPLFFEVVKNSIPSDHDDYFQVSKPEPEYYLNFLSAVWLNEINDESFQSYEKKRIMAPGCMRPENGQDCEAIKDGVYLKCTQCNKECNVYKLVEETNNTEFDVRIALHQSTFKADVDQLKDKGIVGVACAGCLASGGLMLEEKGIQAKCLILNKPGCVRHWSQTGEMTSIASSQLSKILKVQVPVACNESDS